METKRCLVLLPIGVSLRKDTPIFLAIYQHILRPALLATGWPLDIRRGDEVLCSGLTLPEGRRWLQEPHLVVADVTTRHSGVLHDLRLRAFLAERTILVSQQATDFPAHLATYRQILYTFSEAGMAQLYRELQQHVDAILGAPIWPATTALQTPRLTRGRG